MYVVVPSRVLFAVVYTICDHAQENLAQLGASKHREKIDCIKKSLWMEQLSYVIQTVVTMAIKLEELDIWMLTKM